MEAHKSDVDQDATETYLPGSTVIEVAVRTEWEKLTRQTWRRHGTKIRKSKQIHLNTLEIN